MNKFTAIYVRRSVSDADICTQYYTKKVHEKF